MIKFFAIFILLNIAFVMFPKQTSAQNEYENFQVFYDELSPYGQWVDYLNYGYVWIPNAGPDFVPYYSAGHWILTNYGWTWVSDYNWGWAPFHYGRWNFDNYYGWYWVPGNEWAPAWVIWRHARGYYGWAPMAPGISIGVSYGRDYRMPYDRWIFVGDRDFCRHDFYRYHVDRSRNTWIINNSYVINNTYVDNSRHSTYYSGPRREEVQYYSRNVVKVVNIRDNDRPAQNLNNNQLNIYRPNVHNSEKDRNINPAKIYNIKEVKPITNRANVNNSTNNDFSKKHNDQQLYNNPDKHSIQQQNINPNKKDINQINNNSGKQDFQQQDNKIKKQNTLEQNNTSNNQGKQQQNNSPNKQIIQQQNINQNKKNFNQPNKQDNQQQNITTVKQNFQQQNNNQNKQVILQQNNSSLNEKGKEPRSNNTQKNNNIQNNPQKNNVQSQPQNNTQPKSNDIKKDDGNSKENKEKR